MENLSLGKKKEEKIDPTPWILLGLPYDENDMKCVRKKVRRILHALVNELFKQNKNIHELQEVIRKKEIRENSIDKNIKDIESKLTEQNKTNKEIQDVIKEKEKVTKYSLETNIKDIEKMFNELNNRVLQVTKETEILDKGFSCIKETLNILDKEQNDYLTKQMEFNDQIKKQLNDSKEESIIDKSNLISKNEELKEVCNKHHEELLNMFQLQSNTIKQQDIQLTQQLSHIENSYLTKKQAEIQVNSTQQDLRNIALSTSQSERVITNGLQELRKELHSFVTLDELKTIQSSLVLKTDLEFKLDKINNNNINIENKITNLMEKQDDAKLQINSIQQSVEKFATQSDLQSLKLRICDLTELSKETHTLSIRLKADFTSLETWLKRVETDLTIKSNIINTPTKERLDHIEEELLKEKITQDELYKSVNKMKAGTQQMEKSYHLCMKMHKDIAVLYDKADQLALHIRVLKPSNLKVEASSVEQIPVNHRTALLPSAPPIQESKNQNRPSIAKYSQDDSQIGSAPSISVFYHKCIACENTSVEVENKIEAASYRNDSYKKKIIQEQKQHDMVAWRLQNRPKKKGSSVLHKLRIKQESIETNSKQNMEEQDSSINSSSTDLEKSSYIPATIDASTTVNDKINQLQLPASLES